MSGPPFGSYNPRTRQQERDQEGRTMKKVMVESPHDGSERCNEYVKAIDLDIERRGEVSVGVDADLLVVYTDLGITQDMFLGIARAQNERRPIQYRSLVSGK